MRRFRRTIRESKKQNLLKQNIINNDEEVVDQDEEGMTPGISTPTGTQQAEQSAEQPIVGMSDNNDEEKKQDAMVDLIMQELKKRENDLNLQNQQEFAVRQQEYQKFMQEIEKTLANYKGK